MVSLTNLVAFAILTTILDLAEGYDVREIGNVSHRVTIEAPAPAPADAQLALIVPKNEARVAASILDSISSPVAHQTLHAHGLPEEV